MTDAMWSRNVRTRLVQQYPRIPRQEIDAMLDLWLRILEPELRPPALRQAVEDQVRWALRAMTATLPRQRVPERQRGPEDASAPR